MSVFSRVLLLGGFSIILAACAAPVPAAPGPLSTEQSSPALSEPSPTSELEAVSTPTPTIVWFPPTATPTPFPTPVFLPTPEMKPGIGAVVLQDDFSSPGSWTLGSSGEGRAGLSRNELTLAIGPSASKDYILSLREEPLLGDFYAEITASPNLCRGSDEYGLLVRAASSRDYYRFALSCNGQARLDRVIQNQTTSPQPWMEGVVPPGAPNSYRLAVWAAGREMRFFVNDQYLFTVSDPLLPSGSIGVFARSVNENAVTINFSDLVIYEITP